MKLSLGIGSFLLLAAAGTLGAIAVRAKEPSYVVPAGEVPLVLDEPLPEGCELRAFDVEGICCKSCAGKLSAALRAVDGVEAVAVDPIARQVSAYVRREVPQAELTGALTFDDYVARAR